MPKKPEPVLVREPDRISFDCWLATLPDFREVKPWLMSLDAYFTRMEQQYLSEQEKQDDGEEI